METKSMPRQYKPVSIEGEDFHDFMLPADSPDVPELFATANKLEEGLTEYNPRLVEMKTRVAEVQDDRKEEYLSQVENLENMKNLFAVKYKYGNLKKSRGDVWDDLKVATEEAWSELEFY